MRHSKMAKLSISQAARDWSIARSTLQRAIQNGTVSIGSHKNNRKTVDTSEMMRVYGEPSSVAKVSQSVTDRDTLLQAKDALIRQLEKENEFLREQVENLNTDLREIRRPILPRLLPWMRD